MSRILLEICCGSADDVIQAAKGGADRVELNASLFQGGLTPSVGSLAVAKRETKIPIMTMIRPRAGGFCYTDAEFQTMLWDARALLEHGADGIVFGCLHPDGTVDEERCRALVDAAQGKPCVFHRALDVTPDWKRALETLIGLGVTRVLTSGQAPDVFFALETIAQMIRFAGDAIEILPGAGITLQNVRRVAEATGCTQVHLARHRSVEDASTRHRPDIYFGGALYPPEDRYDITDADYICAVRHTLEGRA
ncbi:MAG TPA: copper homeostasis protein CutC [Candidatus Limiplasma stercoravium]|nr:copper homeostasis protein CutC [Candidatus Limiplasma stercoravium]